jgi:hypothetical protein
MAEDRCRTPQYDSYWWRMLENVIPETRKDKGMLKASTSQHNTTTIRNF